MLSALTVSLNKLGDLRFRMDRLHDTRSAYRRSLALRRHALAEALAASASAGAVPAAGDGDVGRAVPDNVVDAVSA